MMRINLIRDMKSERRNEQLRESGKKWREANPEASRKSTAAWRANNIEEARANDREQQRLARLRPGFREAANARREKWMAKPGVRERQLERLKAWQRDNPERARRSARNSHLKKAYGITYDQMIEMLAAQGGKCALCDCVLDPLGKSPKNQVCVDHCHDTQRVRGLLCVRHNNALGALGDNAAGLMRAINYLKEEVK